MLTRPASWWGSIAWTSPCSDRVGSGQAPATFEESREALEGIVEHVHVRQRHDPHVVRTGPVESGTVSDQQVLLEQEIDDQLLVVVNLVDRWVQPGERVDRALRLDTADAGDLVQPVVGDVALLEQPAPGQDRK